MKFLLDRLSVFLKELEKNINECSAKVTDFKCLDCGYKDGDALPSPDIDGWRDFAENDRWGEEKNSHCWLHKVISVPENMRGKPVWLRVTTQPGYTRNSEPQFIVYVDGHIAHGVDHNHSYILLEGRDEYDVYIYAYSGWNECLHGLYCTLSVRNPDCYRLYWHLKVPFEVMNILDENTKDYADTLTAVNNAVNLVDTRNVGSEDYYSSIRTALDYLDSFYASCSPADTSTVCIGHTHIDVAWLWPLEQTVEKTVRSFSTVVALMKEYPDYKFMSSQAQLYKFLKLQSLETYEEVRRMVAAGRWEVEGAMWVEADCNLTSGESLVRQIMFGKRFFKNEFGVDSRVLWLPDVFGYSAALPQILRKSGVDKFVTSKISWNEFNMMPYDTFTWEGIDGTGIFSYFLTAQDTRKGEKPHNGTTYNAQLNASQVNGAWNRYQQKDINNETLLTFGYGDGGGGPTAENMENYERLSKGMQGIPTAKIEFAGDFLERIKQRTEKNKKLPTWVGELYLEYHRGTYTSIAKNKRNNRKSEFLYQTTELASAVNSVLNAAEYPQEKLNEGWECILLNQFHDIIPGSSIKAVYDKSSEQYEALKASARGLLDSALGEIAQGVNTEGGVLVFNPQSFKNSGTVKLNGKSIYVSDIPAKGYKVVKEYSDTNTIKINGGTAENDFFILEFAEDWTLARIYDKKNNREVLQQGKRGNVLEVYEDMPRAYDAWEISNYYTEKRWEIDNVSQVRTVDDGERKGVEITRCFYDSEIKQTVWLYEHTGKIDFDTKLDWHREHLLLKAAFPVDVHSDKAVFDIQFGNVERPTHKNTSWDAAKFEVCAHKFADYSEYGYGVSIMNDCKYGHDIHDSVIRLTLLKCATNPNPEADKGSHEFVYSLFPHKDSFREAGTVQLAYDLNNPMSATELSASNGVLPEEFSFVACSEENVVVDTVKKAEDSECFVVRMFECYNKRSRATLNFGFDVKSAVLCDLMENDLEPLAVSGNSVTLDVKPFEIVTIKLEK